jgi:hypothetical protein
MPSQQMQYMDPGNGSLPIKLGSAKVACPSPPKLVPKREKTALCKLIGRILPSQSSQPSGAHLKAKSRISPRHGSIG